jgi:hypothetical protein
MKIAYFISLEYKMEKTDSLNINQIFEDALTDPSLLSTLDIDNLLESIENTKNDYLDNKTTSDITSEIQDKLNEIGLSDDEKEIIIVKLKEYRFVDEIHELHKGKMVRWIRNGTNRLTNGGIVTDIKFLDNGVHVLCMNSQRRFIQYKYDDCYTFQKMNVEEQLILMAYEELS